jgi:hypothetical protein
MLRAMDTIEPDLETLRRIARLAGFDWTDDELRRLIPAVAAARRSLARLESAPVGGVEPTTLYRVL